MFIASLKEGTFKGIKTTLMLAKIIIPIHIVVSILKSTPLLDKLSLYFEPFMGLFNLPGEAALALVLGNFVNLYAAIGIITGLHLSAFEITTLGLMLSISHSLIVETAIIKSVGAKALSVLFIRISLSIALGLLFGNLCGGLF
ncbi:MAG: nucleoside recognition protein [Firmicutes bacterium]|nr:nucleoside recognition protein [Bacillota bacterium]